MARANGPRPTRTQVALSCTVCGGRNYKTTRNKEMQGQLSLKKFCRTCGQHTLHIESK